MPNKQEDCELSQHKIDDDIRSGCLLPSFYGKKPHTTQVNMKASSKKISNTFGKPVEPLVGVSFVTLSRLTSFVHFVISCIRQVFDSRPYAFENIQKADCQQIS